MPDTDKIPPRLRCKCNRAWHPCGLSTEWVGTSLFNSRRLAQPRRKRGQVRAKWLRRNPRGVPAVDERAVLCIPRSCHVWLRRRLCDVAFREIFLSGRNGRKTPGY